MSFDNLSRPSSALNQWNSSPSPGWNSRSPGRTLLQEALDLLIEDDNDLLELPPLAELETDVYEPSRSSATQTPKSEPSMEVVPEPRPLMPPHLAPFFGPDPKAVQIIQGGIGDCYALAALDTIFNHPKAFQILSRFHITAWRGGKWSSMLGPPPLKYFVVFPSGKHLLLDHTEVGQIRNGRPPASGPLGIEILELAYGQLIRSHRNAALAQPLPNEGRGYTPDLMSGGNAERALQDMLGGELVQFVAGEDTWLTNRALQLTEPLAQSPFSLYELKHWLAAITADTDHIYLLTAATPEGIPLENGEYDFSLQLPPSEHPVSAQRLFWRNHTYAVRDFNLANNTITVVNPHDTQNQIYTMSPEEFCQAFQSISGVRLSLAALTEKARE